MPDRRNATMENRLQEIKSRKNRSVKIGVIPGHFATNHSHVNYYVDMTSIKTSAQMARAAAEELSVSYSSTHVETIICLEGTEVLGAYLAMELSAAGINRGSDIKIVTPELNANNQLIFRDNTQKMIWGKHVIVLVSSASTGKTISRTVDCLRYYNGQLAGIAAIFSAIKDAHGVTVNSIFTQNDLPNYENCTAEQCKMCAAGMRVDALINSYGYSKLG